MIFFAATVPVVRGGSAIGVYGDGQEITYTPFLDHGPPGEKGHLTRPNGLSKPCFYSDMSAEEADHWEKLLLPHSQDAFETPLDYIVSDSQIPLYYIISEEDAAIPEAIQRSISKYIPSCTVFNMDAGYAAYA
ncbi:hypothetical protein BX600DRAFT_518361 [Xylariales sp. PMI_506]|nr:hypothetical protein BX600DRAFT_518361 [Xylariales sp. PMI_506]